ncbi:hypothetical protein WAI453_006416 [Rhynchosporium graminicola]
MGMRAREASDLLAQNIQQRQQEFIMSRQATHQALKLLGSEAQVFERCKLFLSKQSPSQGKNVQDGMIMSLEAIVILKSLPGHSFNNALGPTTSSIRFQNTLRLRGSTERTRTTMRRVQLSTSSALGQRSVPSHTRPGPMTDHTSLSIDHNKAGEAFLRVKTEFDLAATLLEILSIWGGLDIPRMMVDRILLPRKRWNAEGEIEEAMVDSDIGTEFAQCTDAITYLCSSGLVVQEQNEDRLERLTVTPVLHHYLEQQHIRVSENSRAKALIISCHLFPGDNDIEPFHHKYLGRLQLRPLQFVAKYIIEFATKGLLSIQQQYNVIETLLESSKFPDPTTGSTWQFQALEIADTMLAKSPKDEKLEELQMWQQYEEKPCLVWSLVKYLSSQIFLHSGVPKVQGRMPFTGNFAFPERKIVCRKRVRFERARFFYLDGRFEKAQLLFEQELKTVEKLGDNLICFLAGAHCELGNPQKALRFTESTTTGSRDQGARNRLSVLLAEVHLHLGLSSCNFDPTPYMDRSARASFNKARIICERAINSYESIPNFDQSSLVDSVAKVDRMGYLRVLTIIARISFIEAIFDDGDLSLARREWMKVLDAAQRCDWGKPGFMEGNSYYIIGAIEIFHDQINASEHIEYARTLLTGAGLRNTFIGLGSIWFDLVGHVISKQGGRRINLTDQCS